MGRVLALAWVLLWGLFNILSAIGEGLVEGWGVFVFHFVFGLIFVALGYVTIRWEKISRFILIIVGLLLLLRFSRGGIDIIATMALPPIAAGVIMLVVDRKR